LAGEILGRSRPTFIRSIGEKLLDRYSGQFTEDFEENKEMVENLTDVSSKRLRNRIAGFITDKKNSEATQ